MHHQTSLPHQKSSSSLLTKSRSMSKGTTTTMTRHQSTVRFGNDVEEYLSNEVLMDDPTSSFFLSRLPSSAHVTAQRHTSSLSSAGRSHGSGLTSVASFIRPDTTGVNSSNDNIPSTTKARSLEMVAHAMGRMYDAVHPSAPRGRHLSLISDPESNNSFSARSPTTATISKNANSHALPSVSRSHNRPVTSSHMRPHPPELCPHALHKSHDTLSPSAGCSMAVFSPSRSPTHHNEIVSFEKPRRPRVTLHGNGSDAQESDSSQSFLSVPSSLSSMPHPPHDRNAPPVVSPRKVSPAEPTMQSMVCHCPTMLSPCNGVPRSPQRARTPRSPLVNRR